MGEKKPALGGLFNFEGATCPSFLIVPYFFIRIKYQGEPCRTKAYHRQSLGSSLPLPTDDSGATAPTFLQRCAQSLTLVGNGGTKPHVVTAVFIVQTIKRLCSIAHDKG